MRRTIARLSLGCFILTAAVPAAAVSPNAEYRMRQIFDATVLRPLGCVQVVTPNCVWIASMRQRRFKTLRPCPATVSKR